MKNKIEDLRNHLFAALEALADTDNPMDVDRAQAIANVAGVIVNSAKVEMQFIRLTGGTGSGFIPEKQIAGPDSASRAPNGTTHKLRG